MFELVLRSPPPPNEGLRPPFPLSRMMTFLYPNGSPLFLGPSLSCRRRALDFGTVAALHSLLYIFLPPLFQISRSARQPLSSFRDISLFGLKSFPGDTLSLSPWSSSWIEFPRQSPVWRFGDPSSGWHLPPPRRRSFFYNRPGIGLPLPRAWVMFLQSFVFPPP